MKKLLLATTALALSAGLAHAQGVTINGNGRMGLVHTRTAGTGTAAQIAAQQAAVTTAAANVAAVSAAAATAQAAYAANPTAANLAALTVAQAALASANSGLTAAQAALTGLAGTSTTVMENRLRLHFNVLVEADHGLTFGGFIRAQSGSTNGAAYSGVFSGSRIWVESNGLRLTFGNQDGAIQSRLVGAQLVGYTGGTFNGSSAGMYSIPQGQTSNGAGPNQRVAVQYEANGYFVHVSHDRSAGTTSAATEIAVGGTFGQFSAMLGYANAVSNTALGVTYNTPNNDVLTLAGAYNGGSWGVSAIVARLGNGIAGGGTNWMLGGNVALGGGTLNGYVGRAIDGVAATSDNTYGLGYSYGLGGGARVAAGIERTNDVTRAEVGVAFNF